MQVAIIGLGRMGKNMAKRLLKDNHKVIVYNRTFKKAKEMEKDGATSAKSMDQLTTLLKPPRVVIIMLPAGRIVDEHIRILKKILSEKDIVIDGGNSYYKDDIRRKDFLDTKGIHYMDAGISGGIWGLKIGYCTMLGGSKEDFEYVEPIFKSMAPEDGYLHCGPVGAGHFVKMVHNGIEYALMEAYGEGFEILKASPFTDHISLDKIAHLWNQGSVIRSWLLELAADAFRKDPELSSISGYVEDSGEGRWTAVQAIESGVSATAIAHALFKRFQSRQDDTFSDKVLAALRNEFGGHRTVEQNKNNKSAKAGVGEIKPSTPAKEYQK